MGISYLNNNPWNSWSREERLFCAVLFEYGRRDAHGFARWLIESASLDISTDGDWDLGYEVCLYRDYLWQLGGDSVVDRGLPRKRTFDLCLFGEASLVIIEAKVCQGFKSAQNEDFEADRERISQLDRLKHLQVAVVALASGIYLANAHKYSPKALAVFDGQVSWLQAAERFNEALFEQAEKLYKGERGQFINS